MDTRPIAESILHFIKTEHREIDDIDVVRRAVGRVMTAIHHTILSGCKTQEERDKAFNTCLESIQSFIGSLNNSMRVHGNYDDKIIHYHRFEQPKQKEETKNFLKLVPPEDIN